MANSKGYLGNQNIKKKGSQIEWTSEMIQEYLKCSKDIVYFTENYIKIVHVDHGLIPLEMYDYQKEIAEKITNNRRLVVCTARQAGKCFYIDTLIKLRNKKTNEVLEITVGEFYEKIKNQNTKHEKELTDLYTPKLPSSKRMFKLSDTVKRKFVESFVLNNWEVYTDTGWEEATHLHKTIEYTEWELVLENDLSLVCADDHIVFTENEEEIFVKDLQSGDLIMTKAGLVPVKTVKKTNRKSQMFDMTVNSSKHRFYTNDILSHNTTTAVAVILHYVLFNDHKTVALLANKGDTAREILSRIKIAYEALPSWIQQGVVEWNKGSVELENGCKVIAAATSSSAIRGSSCSLVYIDETGFVENWDEFFRSVYPTISSGKTTKMLLTSCVTKDTLVWDKRRGLTEVSDYIVDNGIESPNIGYEIPPYQVLGYNKFNEGRIFVNSGKTKILQVNTPHTELKGSHEHKVWAYKDGFYDWYKLKDLSVGDFIAIRAGNNIWLDDDDISDFNSNKETTKFGFDLSDKITIDLAYLFGLHIAGDCVSNNRIHDFIYLFEYIGFDFKEKTKTKKIPQRLTRMSKENVASMLSGIFDGCRHRQQKDVNRLSYYSEYEKLIDQIKMLLMNFGILSKKMRQNCNTFRLDIDEDYAELFYKEIRYTKTVFEHTPKKRFSYVLYEIEGVCEKSLYWEEIQSIKCSIDKVYDFSLDDVKNDKWCHSVLYNGIIGHQTPNGLNHFYKIFEGAVEERNGYEWVKVTWDRVPGRDENWKKETIDALGGDTEAFAQEYECQFLGSSGTLIDGSTLKNMFWREPLTKSNKISFYEKPKKEHFYITIVDVSHGKGLDYSAFQVIDITKMPYRLVASYRDNTVTPYDYAQIISYVHKLYNESYILIEVNDIGQQISHLLHYDLEIDNVLSTSNYGRRGKSLSFGFGKNSERGIRTTKTVKAIGCNMLKMLIEQKQLIINDFDTINELSTFSRKGFSYQAEPGKHDDLVMCLVLFGWITDQKLFKDMTDINTLEQLKTENQKNIEEDVPPLGFNTSDMMEDDDY